MRKMVCRASFAAAVTCALLTACAEQPATPTYVLPAGPTPEEVADYTAAQVKYRSADGNGDAVMHALKTFSQISQEILARQDPRLFDAQLACERYRVAESYLGKGMQTSFEPHFRYACTGIELRYIDATAVIRKDLEERIAAADLAIIAQTGAQHP